MEWGRSLASIGTSVVRETAWCFGVLSRKKMNSCPKSKSALGQRDALNGILRVWRRREQSTAASECTGPSHSISLNQQTNHVLSGLSKAPLQLALVGPPGLAQAYLLQPDYKKSISVSCKRTTVFFQRLNASELGD